MGLFGRANSKGGSTQSGSNTFDDVNLRKAADLSRRIRTAISNLQFYATDLFAFLEELDPANDELQYCDEDLVNNFTKEQQGNRSSKNSRAIVPPPTTDDIENNKPKKSNIGNEK